jgi:hypothetical protein
MTGPDRTSALPTTARSIAQALAPESSVPPSASLNASLAAQRGGWCGLFLENMVIPLCSAELWGADGHGGGAAWPCWRPFMPAWID